MDQAVHELQQQLASLIVGYGEQTTQIANLSAVIEQQRQTIERHETSITTHQQQIAPQEAEFTDEVPPANFVPDYQAIKNLAAFNGNREQYADWRKQATDTMAMYAMHKANGVYYNALSILRNGKITGLALRELTSHNTPKNFDAIIKRFDHAYAEKRSLELLRQQMQLLNQGMRGPMEFFDVIEKHLNIIIGKIQIEYEGKPDAINSWVKDSRKEALRTLLRGLQPAIAHKLQLKHPSNILDAYGKLQEVEIEYEHQKLFNAYSAPVPRRMTTHPNLQSNERVLRPSIPNQHQQPFVRPYAQAYVPPNSFNEQKQSPVERYQQGRNNYGFQKYQDSAQRSFFTRPSNNQNDDVSMKVLPEKRVNSGQLSFQNKQQRINHIDVEGTDEQLPPDLELTDEQNNFNDTNDEPEEDTISFLE